MNQNKKMIIFDIDGTIRDNANDKIWPNTIKTIKELKEKGHELVIASGRAYTMLRGVEEVIPYIDHYIMLNGQQIMSHGKEIYKDVYEIEKIERITSDLNKANIPYAFVSKDKYALNKIDEDIMSAYNKFHLQEYLVDKDYYKKAEIYEMWCFGSLDKINEFSKNEKEFDIVSWGCEGFDILKKGHSKAGTIKILANILNIDIKDVIAIGDGLNDYEMIKEVGTGIAMGNADPLTKTVADIVTDNIEEDGLYKAFKKIGLVK